MNIVLIISDDHGHPDYGFMGSPVVQTPNLDRLAREGVVFTHGYATSSVCQPSLRTLLTGLEPIQWRARNQAAKRRGVVRPGAPAFAAFDTLPTLLRSRGYSSFKAGKFSERNWKAAGFDEGTRDQMVQGYLTTDFGRPSIEEALRFIRDHRNEPFFLWFAPMLPHVPFDASQELQARYEEQPPLQRDYYANVTRFDGKVGELLSALGALGLRERTLVIFTADNGWDPSGSWTFGGDGPRGKLTPHELGLRTPIIIDLPGAVARRSSALVSITDVAPTVLEVAGVPVPPALPGRSLLPFLRREPMEMREEILGWMPSVRPTARAGHEQQAVRVTGGAYFLRDERFHYFWLPRVPLEGLYETAGDSEATENLVSEHPLRVQRYRRRLRRWSKQQRVMALLGLPTPDPQGL